MPHSMADLRAVLSTLPTPSNGLPPLHTFSDNYLKSLLLKSTLSHLPPDEVKDKLQSVYVTEIGRMWLEEKEREPFGDGGDNNAAPPHTLSPLLLQNFFPPADTPPPTPESTESGTYSLTIPTEMLGLTVENVLERTIIRTVIPHGAAQLAGAQVGSVIVRVGGRECGTLTHFETIDELRQSQRPLKLTLRRIPDAALKEGRREMSRLIQSPSTSSSESANGGTPNSDDAAPNNPPVTACTMSVRLTNLFLTLATGYQSVGNHAASLSLGKILKDYIKRCSDLSNAQGGAKGGARGGVSPAVNYALADGVDGSPPSAGVEVSIGSEEGGVGAENHAAFHFTSNTAVINETVQRSQALLSDFSEGSPVRACVFTLVKLLLSVLEVKEEEKGGKKEVQAPQYDIEDNDSTDDLGPSGNLLKLLLRHICNNHCNDRTHPNLLLQTIHTLSGSSSALSRKVGVSMTPILWTFVDFPHHLQLRGIVTRSLHDVEEGVRAATGRVLMEIVEMLDGNANTTPWLVLMCERGMTDPVGELRGNAVGLVCAICDACRKQKMSLEGEGGKADSSSELFMDIYLLQCKLLPIATRLAEDKSPMVRLAVASQTDRLMSALGVHWLMVLVDLFQALLGDSDEKVRSEAVYCIPRLIATILESEDERSSSQELQAETLSSLLHSMSRMLSDTSVGVRVSLATSAGQLLVLISRNDHSGSGVVGDDERSSFTVSADSSPSRSGSVAVSPHMHFVDESILPLVQRLLHDPDPSVCSNALRAVANASQSLNKGEEGEGVDFVPVLKEKQVLRLLPTLSHLAENEKWRVRRSAVEVVPALVKSTGGMKARAEIGKLVVGLLSDPVAEVRKSAAFSLCVASSSGNPKKKIDDWLDAVVMPHLQACIVSQNFRQRLVALDMLRTLIDNQWDGGRGLTKGRGGKILQFIEMCYGMRNDSLPNVRLNACRVFCDVPLKEILVGLGKREKEAERMNGEIVEGLKLLLDKDKDRDVIYFSRLALKKLGV